MRMQLPSSRAAAPGSRPGVAGRGALIPAIVIVAVVLLAYAAFHHRENKYEKAADAVTRAIAANDMRPVERHFNALRRPELEDRAKVGALSDFVNRQGAFKRTKEDTPADAQPGYHHFVAEFERGNLSEDMTLDGDGKVADFHVRPPDAK